MRIKSHCVASLEINSTYKLTCRFKIATHSLLKCKLQLFSLPFFVTFLAVAWEMLNHSSLNYIKHLLAGKTTGLSKFNLHTCPCIEWMNCYRCTGELRRERQVHSLVSHSYFLSFCRSLLWLTLAFPHFLWVKRETNLLLHSHSLFLLSLPATKSMSWAQFIFHFKTIDTLYPGMRKDPSDEQDEDSTKVDLLFEVNRVHEG